MGGFILAALAPGYAGPLRPRLLLALYAAVARLPRQPPGATAKGSTLAQHFDVLAVPSNIRTCSGGVSSGFRSYCFR